MTIKGGTTPMYVRIQSSAGCIKKSFTWALNNTSLQRVRLAGDQQDRRDARKLANRDLGTTTGYLVAP
jgi:hypothetical protein